MGRSRHTCDTMESVSDQHASFSPVSQHTRCTLGASTQRCLLVATVFVAIHIASCVPHAQADGILSGATSPFDSGTALDIPCADRIGCYECLSDALCTTTLNGCVDRIDTTGVRSQPSRSAPTSRSDYDDVDDIGDETNVCMWNLDNESSSAKAACKSDSSVKILAYHHREKIYSSDYYWLKDLDLTHFKNFEEFKEAFDELQSRRFYIGDQSNAGELHFVGANGSAERVLMLTVGDLPDQSIYLTEDDVYNGMTETSYVVYDDSTIMFSDIDDEEDQLDFFHPDWDDVDDFDDWDDIDDADGGEADSRLLLWERSLDNLAEASRALTFRGDFEDGEGDADDFDDVDDYDGPTSWVDDQSDYSNFLYQTHLRPPVISGIHFGRYPSQHNANASYEGSQFMLAVVGAEEYYPDGRGHHKRRYRDFSIDKTSAVADQEGLSFELSSSDAATLTLRCRFATERSEYEGVPMDPFTVFCETLVSDWEFDPESAKLLMLETVLLTDQPLERVKERTFQAGAATFAFGGQAHLWASSDQFDDDVYASHHSKADLADWISSWESELDELTDLEHSSLSHDKSLNQAVTERSEGEGLPEVSALSLSMKESPTYDVPSTGRGLLGGSIGGGGGTRHWWGGNQQSMAITVHIDRVQSEAKMAEKWHLYHKDGTSYHDWNADDRTGLLDGENMESPARHSSTVALWLTAVMAVITIMI